jgi:hypothetical protein
MIASIAIASASVPVALAQTSGTGDEGPILGYVPADVQVFEDTESVGKECSADLCAEAGVQNGKFTVFVTPQLFVNDRGFLEYVAGNVVGTTTAGKKRIREMRVGGALIRHDTCASILEDGVNLEYGDKTKEGRKSVVRGLTQFYRGFNKCWAQTGHNYFAIETRPRNVWRDFVFGDIQQSF